MRIVFKHLCFFLAVSLVLFVSCAVTNKANPSIGLTNTKEAVSARMNAESIPEGLKVTINNIPADITFMYISMQKGGVYKINGYDDVLCLWDENHASLKPVNTFEAICPFVENGQEYVIRAYFGHEKQEEDFWIDTTAMAGGGIHLANAPVLSVDINKSTATLSELPVFSEKVNIVTAYYPFSIELLKSQDASWGYSGDLTDPLIIDFSKMETGFAEEGNPIKGIPAIVTAKRSIVYNNLVWEVPVASSERFIIN